ncbi:MAG TPA: hypothetical protein VHP83_13120 [Aggregatilineaceae bacterium]|nr:hypothetical protein [Aggregatilineaceae bacterium]
MDITRNWRLKTARVQLLATRCPVTGEVVIPQQSAAAVQPVELYRFEMAEQPRLDEVGYAKAAR